MEDEIILKVKELVSILKNNNLKSISIESKDLTVKIEDSEEKVKFYEKEHQYKQLEQKETMENLDNTVIVNAPLVGTFYRAPSPDSSPFIDVGDIIEPKQTLCIIEAMKVMNEITAECKGKVLEILPENGEMVEFGKPLIRIQPIEE
jgi:acetyl-CoA carboxylase biotin carboxyl carrier protein